MVVRSVTYLDTHVAVWLYAGNLDLFSPEILREIETADLLISPAAALEMQLLQETGRLSVGPDEILAALERDIGLHVCQIPFPEIARAARSHQWTRDPFDRLIVAQAEAGEGRLITKDRRIHAAYSRAIW